MVLGLLALLGLGYAVMASVRLWHSILPGSAASPSMSMEPYAFVFRFDASSSQEDSSSTTQRAPSEWRLSMPRAFVSSELGDDSSVGGGRQHQSHSVTISATLNPATGDFSPAILSTASERSAHGFFFFLGNGPVGEKLARSPHCIRQDEIDEFFGTSKLSVNFFKANSSFEQRCMAYMSDEGWCVRLEMPKKVYFDNYQCACYSASEMLKKYTTKADYVNEN